jgi:hypothetical protein
MFTIETQRNLSVVISPYFLPRAHAPLPRPLFPCVALIGCTLVRSPPQVFGIVLVFSLPWTIFCGLVVYLRFLSFVFFAVVSAAVFFAYFFDLE